MTKNEMEIIEAIKNDTIYDYVSNHYWEMDKSELVDLLKEFIFELTSCKYLTKEEKAKSRVNIIESLVDRGWGDEEDE